MPARLVLSVFLFASVITGSARATELPGSHWMAKVTVVRVLLASDGDAISRAYLVRWKGQDVVAEDILATSDYHVGDQIKVLVVKTPFPNKRRPYGLLSFHILPKKV